MAEQDEALLKFMQRGYTPDSFTVDEYSGRKVINPSKFTLGDAEIHYSYDRVGKGDVRAKLTRFGSSQRLLGSMTIEDIAKDPKRFRDAVLLAVTEDKRANTPEKKEKLRAKIFAETRVILAEVRKAVPREYIDTVTKALPLEDPNAPETIAFYGEERTKAIKGEANLPIRDTPENIRTWFNGLDRHATDVKSDAVLVDAIKYGANTGVRPSLITKLKLKNIQVLENGEVWLRVPPETTGAKQKHTRAGGGGQEKKIRLIRVPVNSEAAAILLERKAAVEERYAGLSRREMMNKNVFWMSEVDAKDPTKIKMRDIKTDDLDRVLSTVEVPDGLVENLDEFDYDELKGKTYSTLHIDNPDRAKTGTEMLRNMHTHLSKAANLDPHVIDYLQARKSPEKITHMDLGYWKQASDTPAPEALVRELSKFDEYYNKVQVSLRSYPPGEEGRALIQQKLDAVREGILSQGYVEHRQESKEAKKSIQDERKRVAQLVRDELKITDPERIDSITETFKTRSSLQDVIDYVNDPESPHRIEKYDLTTARGLLAAKDAERKAFSKASFPGALRGDAAAEAAAEAAKEGFNYKGETTPEGTPRLTDTVRSKVAAFRDKRKEAKKAKKEKDAETRASRRIGKTILRTSLPFVGAYALFGEAKAEEAFREEDAGDLSISELDESIGREEKFYAQALEEAFSPSPFTTYDAEMMAEEKAIQKQLMQTPEYQQFERQERAEDESRAYDRELGLLDPSGGFRSVARREEERQSEKQEALAAKKEDIRAARSLRRPRDLVEEYSGFIPTT